MVSNVRSFVNNAKEHKIRVFFAVVLGLCTIALFGVFALLALSALGAFIYDCYLISRKEGRQSSLRDDLRAIREQNKRN